MGTLTALTETLRQLLEYRQYRRAETLIDRCRGDILEQLLATSTQRLGSRAKYLVKEQLRLRKRGDEERALAPLEALQPVLNIWCWEGSRAAIRSVLRELDASEVAALCRLPELDAEIVSISREYPLAPLR